MSSLAQQNNNNFINQKNLISNKRITPSKFKIIIKILSSKDKAKIKI